ncbi:triacylglycerol lipase [Clostridium sp. C8-1-8]|uniref:esterase/lipase family protein n=1 Tax=Clostridium sp. C8-1-8 TaxID=2698831 RepID=UPI001FABFD49|nr:triacylglycerol lipase [Clostridium sp. C8-1-8]
MVLLKRILSTIIILILLNSVILIDTLKLGSVINVIALVLLIAYFIKYNIVPMKQKTGMKKLTIMIGGYELVTNACVLFVLQGLVYLYIFIVYKTASLTLISLGINALVYLAAIFILLWNGLLRIILTSSQVGIVLKISLFFTWWIPILNIILFWKCCHIVRREYIFEISKIELNNQRRESEICKTKYPILLVHGIFWRDWHFFNYWGRIPGELIKNGATIYYGNQQSATSMEICANELKEQILQIIEKEKCEKVNIIAHSKGGIDARYAISCLGIDKNVASLTTIGTPHNGCELLDNLLGRLPDKFVRTLAKKYNSAYLRLGDKTPDFYSAIYDLTVSKCAEFNEKVINKEGVVYQSVTSKMSSMFSAGFPLNICYAIISRKEGENDGFVTVESSKHGDYLGCYSTKGRRGVSHGDMIDLMRENIHEFDVCEFYVDIVKELKLKGL